MDWPLDIWRTEYSSLPYYDNLCLFYKTRVLNVQAKFKKLTPTVFRVHAHDNLHQLFLDQWRKLSLILLDPVFILQLYIALGNFRELMYVESLIRSSRSAVVDAYLQSACFLCAWNSSKLKWLTCWWQDNETLCFYCFTVIRAFHLWCKIK